MVSLPAATAQPCRPVLPIVLLPNNSLSVLCKRKQPECLGLTWPPERNMMPGTAAGTQRRITRSVSSAITSCACSGVEEVSSLGSWQHSWVSLLSWRAAAAD